MWCLTLHVPCLKLHCGTMQRHPAGGSESFLWVSCHYQWCITIVLCAHCTGACGWPPGTQWTIAHGSQALHCYPPHHHTTPKGTHHLPLLFLRHNGLCVWTLPVSMCGYWLVVHTWQLLVSTAPSGVQLRRDSLIITDQFAGNTPAQGELCIV